MKPTEKLLGDLKERAKELNCLYEVEKRLNQGDRPLAEVMAEVVEVIGQGWQFPEYCVASITIEEHAPWEFEDLRGHALAADHGYPGPGRGGGASCASIYTAEVPRRRRGPIPQGRGAAHREPGRPDEPLHPLQKSPEDGQEVEPAGRDGGRCVQPQLAGGDRSVAGDGPQPLRADFPQDAQPPVLHRHRRGPGHAGQEIDPGRMLEDRTGEVNAPAPAASPGPIGAGGAASPSSWRHAIFPETRLFSTSRSGSRETRLPLFSTCWTIPARP